MNPLWDSSKVAEFLGRSPRVVTERYRFLPGFPKPIKFPSESGRSRLAWVPEEIQTWALSQRES